MAWGLVACAVAVLSTSPVTGLGTVLGLAYVVEPALGLALTGWGGPCAVAALVLVVACTALVLASRTSFSGLDVRG